ncbi:tRNA (adenosine(37)-N6)-threonylcarbamoyltransferase complex ATPase subunit type 1 TsaE [Patescibacteria group bacterium]
MNITNTPTISRNPQYTMKMGTHLAQSCRGGEIIALTGSLGSGKTTFVKGLARGLGTPAEKVVSPSFLLIHSFKVRKKNISSFHHIDLWRIDPMSENDAQILNELFHSEKFVIAIEWASRLPNKLKKYITHNVRCTIVDKKIREITIRKKPASNRRTS